MDGRHFDALTRRLSSRRTAMGGLLAGLLLPLAAAARDNKNKNKNKNKNRQRSSNGRDKGKGKSKGKAKKRATAQVEPCWRAGACIPKKGANVSRCDLAGYAPSTTLDCTGCNASRANLRGANLSGANLTKANLSGACLVDATLDGATVTNNTNLYNAIFCRTTMPDGSVNDSGCGAGTACCPTSCTSTADCRSGQRCCQSRCVPETNCCANAECPSNQCENGACLVEYVISGGADPTRIFLVDDDLRIERNGQVIVDDTNGIAALFDPIVFFARPGDTLRVIATNGVRPNGCAAIDPLVLHRTATGTRQVLDADGLDIGCGQPAGVFYDETFKIDI